IDSVITNTAEISNMNETDVDSTPGNGVAGEDDIDSASIYPKDADQIDLELTKQVNAEKVSKGQEIEYSLVVTNNGPDQATGVEVLDKLPTGVSFVSSNGDYDSATGIWSVGSLDKGQSKTLTIKVKVNADKDCIVNIAEVSKADQVDIDSTPGNGVAGEDDQADAKVCLDQKVYDLALTKTVDQSQVAVGDIVNWTITVENQLDTTATGVEVKDVIPAGLEVISTTPATVFNNNTWNIGTINGGETKTLIIKTKVTQIDSVITNTAEISNMNETDVDSTPGNGVAGEDDIDSASIYPKDKPVYICKDLDASVTIGQAPLAVEFTGIGQVVNTNITNYQIDFGDGQNDTNSSGVFSHTYQKAGNYTASLVIQTVDGKTAVTEACKVVISVSEQPIDLELDKMVDVTEIALGDQMTYTLTLENKGPGDATGVEVTDKLPSEVEYISSNAPEGTSYDPATGIWTVGQIAKGQTKTLTITVKVIKEVKITNVAEVTKADQEDVDSTPGNHDPIEDDQDKVVVNPVDNTIDLELDKSISTNSTGKGGVLTYQISVTNKGPADATGVKVSDKLPSGVSFISADGQYDPATGIWELGELNAGQTKTLSIKVKVDKTCENKTITNTAEVAKADQEDIDSTPSNQDASEDDQDSANFRCEKDIVVTNVENVTNVTNTNNVNNVTNTTNQANTTNVAGVSTTTPQVIAQGGKAPVPGTNPVVVPSGTTPATGLASTLSILFASLVLSYLGYSYYQLRKRAEKLGF
ncbi:DUF11 domain-containing protein, partial [Candidatus Saccharibacteria bacterium]|nr:DUF11 domain-containing protein [Candidatus Saccharibacteria bacterium]